ncbi:hypothetical protein A3K82_01425 [Candidatus Pacearchaeota archaeon RBG_19FT_COMBO_34_9]|nr:MAG: hypothetical protein A3K82_01425 [Candidatus Pacearchaeota archaeon RBG_19FT_COMBO_34_9]OGJ16928.1 MAG: hypothetical protein A3K74_02215 [Candidatus Pacearchaeota archaeon RBG_13_33_26]
MAEAKKGGYNIGSIYQGGYSSLSPKYGDVFTGYRINPNSFGITTDPRTANVIQDASTKLNMGIKQIEVTAVSPEIFDAMPKQQLKELNRLSKLTGVDISIHGPVVDSTGISQQGFSEINRESSERKISDAIIRSHELNPDGNIPVTFHAAEGIPGAEWKKIPEKAKGFEGEARRLIAVEKESGKMVPLEEEKRFYPGGPSGEVIEKKYSPEENLRIVNDTEWDNKISQLFFTKERADEILEQNYTQIQHLIPYLNENKGKIRFEDLTQTQQNAYIKMEDAKNYLSEITKNANNIFSKAYKYGNEEQKEKLKELSEIYAKDLQSINKTDILGESRAMHRLLNELQSPQNNLAPEMFVPIEKFAVEQSSKTFGNAAFNAYKKFGEKSPILSIENPPAGFALSTGEDLKNLVEESRKQFVERAKSEGMNESRAEDAAKKLIGVTWDVGHINMLRKQGISEKDIIKETEKVAPLVKHVHLSDNFGFEHTELPMGMGNVPIKEIMDKLGQQGFDAKKIIEAGSWWQHQRTPPFKETLEAFGSPIYSMQMAPYWNQNAGFQQSYYAGLAGQWLPQTHYETFGAGFLRLPMELGGQRGGGEGGRMSGRPME